MVEGKSRGERNTVKPVKLSSMSRVMVRVEVQMLKIFRNLNIMSRDVLVLNV